MRARLTAAVVAVLLIGTALAVAGGAGAVSPRSTQARANVIACPIALVIMSLCSWSQVNGPNAPLFHGPIVAGAILYIVAFAYAIFYNYNLTKSATLAISRQTIPAKKAISAAVESPSARLML